MFKVFILTSEVKFDLGGQRMIYVFTDKCEISNPCNSCKDQMTLSKSYKALEFKVKFSEQNL